MRDVIDGFKKSYIIISRIIRVKPGSANLCGQITPHFSRTVRPGELLIECAMVAAYYVWYRT